MKKQIKGNEIFQLIIECIIIMIGNWAFTLFIMLAAD